MATAINICDINGKCLILMAPLISEVAHGPSQVRASLACEGAGPRRKARKRGKSRQGRPPQCGNGSVNEGKGGSSRQLKPKYFRLNDERAKNERELEAVGGD
jgi:hypothetical protein